MATHNDLSPALPQLIAAEQQLHDYANSIGIDYRIADYGAVRTLDDTNLISQYRRDDYAAAVKADPSVANIPINVWRPIAAFGASYHNYGAAFDVLITNRGNYSTSAAALQALKSAAGSFGLSSEVPNDPPHFELAGISLDEASQMWDNFQAGGGGDGGSSGSVGSADVGALATVAVLGIVFFLLRQFRR